MSATLVRFASVCRHCARPLHYQPDSDPTDLETSEIWWGVDEDSTLGSACDGESADTYPCYACSGKGEDEDGYECDSCGGSCVTADHEPTTREDPRSHPDPRGSLMSTTARPACPACGGPVVLDGGLWHCDEGGDGAWDRAGLIWLDASGNEVDDPSGYTRRAIAARLTRGEG